MTVEGVAGLRAGVDDVRAVLDDLPDATWREPTGCAGWTVQDVVAHMGSIFPGLVDPSQTSGREPGETTEQANERPVAGRRSWSPAEVADEYRTYAPQGIAALEAMNGPAMAETEISLGDLGRYPMG